MSSSTSNKLNQIPLKAVKAVIYRSDGKLLLQKRDGNLNIPYPLHWNLFGGEVEIGEDLTDALKRELIEEIEFSPEEIGKEIFQSTWKSYALHFFPIFIDKNNEEKKLNLKEGLEYKWFSIDELIGLDLVPAIYENLNEISKYLITKVVNFRNKYEQLIESNIIKFLNIKQKNKRVYYANANNFKITSKNMYFFLYLSQFRNLPVSRICLHEDNSSNLHEMYMFHTKPFLVGPLKQEKETISYHIIDGTLEINVENGKDSNPVVLSSDTDENKYSFRSYRLKPSQFRTVKSKTKYCIFLEVNNGPFNDSDTIWK